MIKVWLYDKILNIIEAAKLAKKKGIFCYFKHR